MVKPLVELGRKLASLLPFVLLALLVASPAPGEEFRVENEVFVEDEEEPGSTSITIFHEGLVYDYLDSPKEITVFDREAGRILLLDPVRKIQTELTTQDLEVLSRQLRVWAGGQADDLLRFSARPEFQEEYEATTGGLRLHSPWLSYEAETIKPSRSTILDLYLEFCDWSALLNARLDPGSRPPFPRMHLNRVLAGHERMPQMVQLTVRPKGEKLFAEELTARSRHHLVPHLVESDRIRIAQTDEFMATFRRLPFKEYQVQVQPQTPPQANSR